jgi:hypothetical protein
MHYFSLKKLLNTFELEIFSTMFQIPNRNRWISMDPVSIWQLPGEAIEQYIPIVIL